MTWSVAIPLCLCTLSLGGGRGEGIFTTTLLLATAFFSDSLKISSSKTYPPLKTDGAERVVIAEIILHG